MTRELDGKATGYLPLAKGSLLRPPFVHILGATTPFGLFFTSISWFPAWPFTSYELFFFRGPDIGSAVRSLKVLVILPMNALTGIEIVHIAVNLNFYESV